MLRREALFNLAKNNGCEVSHQFVLDEIQRTKDLLNGEEVAGAENFTSFLEGTGMTFDQYWDSQYDVIKKDCSIDQYFATFIDDFMEENGFDGWTQEAQAQWQRYTAQIADAYIESDHVVDLRAEK